MSKFNALTVPIQYNIHIVDLKIKKISQFFKDKICVPVPYVPSFPTKEISNFKPFKKT